MTGKTKVLFMITKGNFGGAQRYVFDLATNLPKNEYEISVALGEGEILERKLKESGIRVRRVAALGRDIHFGRDFVSFFEIVKILKEERPDILHLNSSKIGGLGGLAGRLAKIPKIIFTGHGWAFNEDRNIISKIIIGFLHWVTIILSHKTIAVSERVREQIRVFPFIGRKVVCIYNGLGDIKFLERHEAREKLVPNQENSIWIGTIAELHKNKGLDFALEAFAEIVNEFKNVIFVVIGEGEERKKIENIIVKYGLTERFFLIGFRENASTLLKAFDIATFTSRTEAMPYVPMEMGLAKLPVIATWVGGIPEIIVNGESGILVQKGNTSELKSALTRLIKDEQERTDLGKNLRERVLEEFNLEKMIKKTEDLYKNSSAIPS